MLKTTAISIYMLTTTAAFSQFAVDASRHEIRKASGVIALEDLAVGEVGLVSYLSGCALDGKLYISNLQPVTESISNYGRGFRVKRLQGNRVEIIAEVGEKAGTKPITEALNLADDGTLNDCAKIPADRLFAVMTINGAPSATELIRKAN